MDIKIYNYGWDRNYKPKSITESIDKAPGAMTQLYTDCHRHNDSVFKMIAILINVLGAKMVTKTVFINHHFWRDGRAASALLFRGNRTDVHLP